LALTTLKSLNAESKQLEAQKKVVEKRDGEVPKALAVLQKYAKVLSPAQRRQVAKLIGETIDAKPARAAKPGKVAPKYRLPTGETWAGRGLAPKVFTQWGKFAQGKAWAQANPGAKFPSADGAVKKAPARVAKKAGKPVKKAAQKAVKKLAKNAVAKKASKKA